MEEDKTKGGNRGRVGLRKKKKRDEKKRKKRNKEGSSQGRNYLLKEKGSKGSLK